MAVWLHLQPWPELDPQLGAGVRAITGRLSDGLKHRAGTNVVGASICKAMTISLRPENRSYDEELSATAKLILSDARSLVWFSLQCFKLQAAPLPRTCVLA